MPQGKAAGVPCVQLDEQLRCKIFGQPERPAVCGQLQASVEMCGAVADGGVHARAWLMRLEELTQPAPEPFARAPAFSHPNVTIQQRLGLS